MNDKLLVAQQAVNWVKDGMQIGLGTGSTANYFIHELDRRVTEENLQITVVASSIVSMIKAQELGLVLTGLEHVKQIDLYVDGADEVAPDLTLLKGRGSDLVREKLLAKASDTFLVLVDESKLVDHIGTRYPIPVEVMPFAWQFVMRSLEDLGGRGELRQNAAKDGLAVTSHGSLVLDMEFDSDLDIKMLDVALSCTPGIVEHGIFRELATAAFVGADGQVQERWAPDQ